MPLLDDDGSYYIPSSGSKKKKKKSSSVGSAAGGVGASTGSGSSSSSTYIPNSHSAHHAAPSGYTPPPSYTKPPKKRKPKPKQPTVEINESSGTTFLDFINSLNDSVVQPDRTTDRARRFPEMPPSTTQSNPLTLDFEQLKRDATIPVDNKDQLSEFLQAIVDPKAPKGYSLGDEKLSQDPNDFEFAYVPEKFKHKGRNVNNPLKWFFDPEGIAERMKGDFVFQSQVEEQLNTAIEKQFWTRSQWLQKRIGDDKQKAIDVLIAGMDAAKKGDFDYVRRAIEKDPNLLDLPRYEEEYGVKPGDIWEQWLRDRKSISDPYVKLERRQRVDFTMEHYDFIRDTYRRAIKKVEEFKDIYESTYDRRVDYWKDSYGDEFKDRREAAKEAGPAIPDLNPPATAEEQANLDAVGKYAAKDTTDDLMQALGVESWAPKRLADQRRKERDELDRIQQRAKEQLGIDELPSMKQMLAIKVAEGNLNPDNPEEIEEWVKRFRNPLHPDTRAMYAGFALEQNPNFHEYEALEFVNAPIKGWQRSQIREAKRVEKNLTDKAVEEAEDGWGWAQRSIPVVGSYLSLLDTDDKSGLERAADTQFSLKEGFHEEAGSGTEGLFWTMDKLARPLYSVAAAVDAWNKIDQEPTFNWTDHGMAFGQNPFGSLDDILENPGKLAEPFKAMGSQFNRNTDGEAGDEIVPTTFSTVIANAAARDGEGNVYDQDWYQHTAGFALDLGLDPLNFVGIGLVNNTLKLPVRVVKEVQNEIGRQAWSYDVLRTINNADRGRVTSHVYEVQQTIGRYPSKGDHVLVSHPEGIPGMDALLDRKASLSDMAVSLKAQQNVYAQETGVSHLYDELAQISDKIKALPFGSETQLRVDRLLHTGNSTKILGTDLENKGGRFWRDFLKPLHDEAIEFGPTKLRYREVGGQLTPKAASAKRAFADLDEIDEFGGYTPELRANTQAKIDAAYENDDAFGGPHAWYEPDVVAYLRTDRGKEFTGKNGFDPVGAFASAMNVPKSQFERMFTKEDVYKALVEGRRLLANSGDETVLRDLVEAQQRIDNSKAVIRALGNRRDKQANEIRNANLTSLQVGYTMNSTLTLAGAVRYLGEIEKLKMTRSKWIDGPLAKHITRQLNRLDDELENANTATDDFFGAGIDNVDPEIYTDYDFAGKPLEEILQDGSGHFRTKTDQLEAIRTEMEAQLDALRLSQTAEVTGLPPLMAHKMNQILPEDSVFRTRSGDIDIPKIESQFTFSYGTNKDEAFSINYKKPAAGPNQARETEFLRIYRDTLIEEQRGAYRAAKTKILKNRGDLPEEITFTKVTPKKKPTVGKSEPGLKPKGNKFTVSGQPDTSLVVKKKPDAPVDLSHVVGPATRKLGPEPTWDSFRKRLPNYVKLKQSKGANEIKVDDFFEVDQETGISVYKSVVTETGKLTNDQKKLRQAFNDFHAAWKRKYNQARALDLTNKSSVNIDKLRLNFDEYKKAQDEAWKLTRQGVAKSLKDTGELKPRPMSTQVTFNALASDARRKAKLEARYAKAQAKIAHAQDDNARALDAELKRIDTELNEINKAIEKARLEAIETAKVMRQRVAEENILQIAQMPPRLTGKQISLFIMGQQKNLQFTNSLFRGAENAGKLIPAKMRESFANYWVRPSKQLSEPESIRLRAMWESQTPVIIHAHLSQLSKAMHNLTASERFSMLRAYRSGRVYEGPKAELADGVNSQMKEIEDILNGFHDFYMFKEAGAVKARALSEYELLRFLPREWSFDPKILSRISNERVTREGAKYRKQKALDPFNSKPAPRNQFTIDDLMEAIKLNGYPIPKDFNDPFTLAWTYRMAADQAHQLRGLKHAIGENFGVRFPDGGAGNPKWKLVKQLEDRYGWQHVPEIDPHTLFPPEAVKDIKKLMELTQPGDARNQVSKLFDNVIGYWKQGMTIYNPGYYTRNGIGEIMSSWLDGVNHPKWYRMAYDVHKYTTGEGQNMADLVKKWSVLEGHVPITAVDGNKVLFTLKGGQKITVEDLLREYVNTGMKSTFANTDIGQGVRGLAGSTLAQGSIRKVGRAVNEKAHSVGEGFEDYLRMAHFAHAMQHSGKGTLKAAGEYAAQRVTKYHFDYTDFSKFEKSVMLRAFPFYKWTRRGAPLMLAHLFMTPGKMTAVPKAMDMMSGLGVDPMNILPGGDPVLSTQDVYEDKNGLLPDYSGIAPGWVRDLFAYQMQPAEDDEYAKYFRVQTPQIDGLNAMHSLYPGDNNTPLDWFGDTAGFPLLNPAIKMPLELGRNKGIDPDFPYEIYGGDYNESRGLNPVEAIATYAMRQLNPWAGFFAKLSKNGDLGPLSVSEGADDRHDVSRDWASQLTGLGFYQGKMGEAPEKESFLKDFVEKLGNPSAVVSYDKSEIPDFSGASAASAPSKPKDVETLKQIISAIETSGFTGGNGSGWVDFPDFKWKDFGSSWRNFGSGWRNFGSGYGGGYSSSGYSSSGGSAEFWELIKKLEAMIDQGKVIDE